MPRSWCVSALPNEARCLPVSGLADGDSCFARECDCYMAQLLAGRNQPALARCLGEGPSEEVFRTCVRSHPPSSLYNLPISDMVKACWGVSSEP